MESEGITDKNDCGHMTTPKITAVGNAWVLSRSKSYSGRIYYFNTLTGEAVWNLSHEEIEKAKKRTAKLPPQSGSFPEPQGPPGDHSNHDSYPDNAQQQLLSQYISPNVSNKSNMNIQYARPQFTPFMNQCQNCSPINPMSTVIGIRPNMWMHPPPLFFTPPNTSLTNINQTTENVPHHNGFNQDFTVQNTSVSLSRRFSYANTTPRGKSFAYHHGVGKFMPKNNRLNHKRPFTPRRTQTQNVVDDLRTRISSKKTGTEILKEALHTVNEPANSTKSPEPLPSASQPESKTVEENSFAKTDDEWLQENGIIKDGELKLDITTLKNLATDGSDCECWYIVVDINVLMKHYNFLNVLTNSESQCKLMVARGVLSLLQTAVRSQASARPVHSGLWKLFATRRAVIGEYTFKPSEITDCTGMINFCEMLQKQNEHIILLTDEEELQKKTSSIPMFTIQELKEFLTSGNYKAIKITSPIIERNIQITIPNDTQSYEHSTLEDEKGPVTPTANNVPIQASSPKAINIETNRKEMIVQTEEFVPPVPKMVDAEVQTDPNLQFTQPAKQIDSVGVNTVDSVTEVSYINRDNNVEKYSSENAATSHENKTREVRLKRSISNFTTKSNMSNDAEKKHIKWNRQRRVGSVALSDSTSSLDDRVSRISSIPFENGRQDIQDTLTQLPSQGTQMYYDIGEGSETSSCIFMNKEPSENVIIEESSTSDVISNSVSIVDSESAQDTSKAKENSNYEVQSKNVMFEITSEEMEQNLKMRRDEWLADFTQIMEEVLTEVLRKKSVDILKAMPPPWTLHEATECIRRTFIGDADVFDAATQLSKLIHRMSDIKGKIKVDFIPKDFMELYSYGVYLVDSLQSIMVKSEDLQIASESLSTLLKKIETPMAEGGCNDSFGEAADVSVMISQSSTETATNQESCSVLSNKSSTPRRNQKDMETQSNQSVGKYNLRSSRKTKPSEQCVESPPVKFIRKINVGDDFFTSLHLQRKGETAAESQNVIKENQMPGNHFNVNENLQSKPGLAEKGPSIIRNFSKCPEFEERLKKNAKEPLDMDRLDYSMGYNDFDEYDDNMEDNYLDDEYDHYANEEGEELENHQLESGGKTAVDSNNNDIEILVTSLINAMKETTENVYKFCKNTRDEMQSDKIDSNRSIEIQDKAQRANAHIQDICNSFRRIQGDMNQTGDGFRSRFKEAGFLLNDNEVNVYRDMIGSCIEHGDTLLESLNVIVEALKP